MKEEVSGALLLLDGFALGGLAALFLTSNLILDKCCSAGQVNQAIYNLLDYILPYKVLFAVAFSILLILTIVVWFSGKLRRTATDLGAK